MQRKSLFDDDFKDFDEKFETGKRTIKTGLIGAGIGLAAGLAGGIYLGESINNYFEVLRQAPAAIHYGVDVASAVVCGWAGASIGDSIAQIPSVYKLLKKF